MKQTALVMKVDAGQMVVVTDEGDFLHLAVPEGERVHIGQYIQVSVPDHNLLVTEGSKAGQVLSGEFGRKRRPHRIWWVVAASIVFLALLSPLGGGLLAPEPVQVLAFEINPAFELWLDKHGRVVEYSPLNDDANKLIDAGSVKGKDWQDAVHLVLEQAESRGFLGANKDNLILVSGAMIKEYARESAEVLIPKEAIQQAVAAFVESKNLSGVLWYHSSTGQDYTAAKNEALSLNRYVIGRELANQGMAVQSEQLRTEKIKSLLNEVQSRPSADLSGDAQVLNPKGFKTSVAGSDTRPVESDSLSTLGGTDSKDKQGTLSDDRRVGAKKSPILQDSEEKRENLPGDFVEKGFGDKKNSTTGSVEKDSRSGSNMSNGNSFSRSADWKAEDAREKNPPATPKTEDVEEKTPPSIFKFESTAQKPNSSTGGTGSGGSSSGGSGGSGGDGGSSGGSGGEGGGKGSSGGSGGGGGRGK